MTCSTLTWQTESPETQNASVFAYPEFPHLSVCSRCQAVTACHSPHWTSNDKGQNQGVEAPFLKAVSTQLPWRPACPCVVLWLVGVVPGVTDMTLDQCLQVLRGSPGLLTTQL